MSRPSPKTREYQSRKPVPQRPVVYQPTAKSQFVMPATYPAAIAAQKELETAIALIEVQLRQDRRTEDWKGKALKALAHKQKQLTQISELIQSYTNGEHPPAQDETTEIPHDHTEFTPVPARRVRTRTPAEKLHFDLLCRSLTLFRLLREEGALDSHEARFVDEIEVAVGHLTPQPVDEIGES